MLCSPAVAGLLTDASQHHRGTANDSISLLAQPGTVLLFSALRVLCSPAVGRPLTDAQLSHLTVSRLVEHLTEAFHHLLALRISAALGLRAEPVCPSRPGCCSARP